MAEIQKIPLLEPIADFTHVFAIGNVELLELPSLGLFCSRSCPATIILKTYDFAQKLKTQVTPIISGFHSPVEKEVLITLLQGTIPIIICPARSIHKMRISSDWKSAIEDGRLLVMSPFIKEHNRSTQKLAELRNDMVAQLAYKVLIAYAQPESKTEAFAKILLANERIVLTFDTGFNSNLLELGSETIKI